MRKGHKYVIVSVVVVVVIGVLYSLLVILLNGVGPGFGDYRYKIGNTCTKILVFNDTIPVYRLTEKKITPPILRSVITSFPVDACMISAVKDIDKSLANVLKKIPQVSRLSMK